MLISLLSDLKKLFRLSLITELVNDSIGSNECRDSTSTDAIKDRCISSLSVYQYYQYQLAMGHSVSLSISNKFRTLTLRVEPFYEVC